LGCDRHTAAGHRRAAGLASNRLHPRQRARVAEKTREQCRAAGVRSLAEVRVLAFRVFAAGSGWPADLKPRHVHILDALEAMGPMTRPEIAAAVGMPWKGSRASLKCKYGRGSYLADLIAAGLVVSLGKIAGGPGKGKGGAMQVYSLAMAAERAVTNG
jgi:hypothetical protein